MIEIQSDNKSNENNKNKEEKTTSVIFFVKKPKNPISNNYFRIEYDREHINDFNDIDNANIFFSDGYLCPISITEKDIQKGYKVCTYTPPLFFYDKKHKDKQVCDINERYIFFEDADNIKTYQKLEDRLLEENNIVDERIQRNLTKFENTFYNLFFHVQDYYTFLKTKSQNMQKNNKNYDKDLAKDIEQIKKKFENYAEILFNFDKAYRKLSSYLKGKETNDESLKNIITEILNNIITPYQQYKKESESLYEYFENKYKHYFNKPEEVSDFKEAYNYIYSKFRQEIIFDTLQPTIEYLFKLMNEKKENLQKYESIKKEVFFECLYHYKKEKKPKFKTYIHDNLDKRKCYIHFDTEVYHGPIKSLAEIQEELIYKRLGLDSGDTGQIAKIQANPLKYFDSLTPEYNLDTKDIEISRSNN